MKAVTLKFIYAHKMLHSVKECSYYFRKLSNIPFSRWVQRSRSDPIALQCKAKNNPILFACNLSVICPRQTFVSKFPYRKLSQRQSTLFTELIFGPWKFYSQDTQMPCWTRFFLFCSNGKPSFLKKSCLSLTWYL